MSTNLINQYPNIASMLVAFADGGKVLRSIQNAQGAKTGSLLILGTATDGPVLEPVAVDDTSYNLFGTGLNSLGFQDGSTLIKAYKVARQIGCNDIRLMRVTGAPAKCEVKAKAINNDCLMPKEEKIGTNLGNTESEFKLSKDNIIEDSITVYCNGVELLTGVTYNAVDKKVTIASNVGSAGKNININYNYNKLETTKQIFVFDVTNSNMVDDVGTPTKGIFKLKYKDASDITVFVNGIEIDAKYFNKVTTTDTSIEVTLKDGGTDILEDSATVTVVYKAVTSTLYSASDNSSATGPFITGTNTMNFVLAKEPVIDSIKLYANGAICKKQDFKYNSVDNSITFNTDVSEYGTELSVYYVYTDTETVDNSLKFESLFGGSEYNLGRIEVTEIKNSLKEVIGKKVTIIKPQSKSASTEKEYSYSSLTYPTLGVLVEVINNDGNGVYKAYTQTDSTPTKDLEVGTIYFNSGDDGINVTSQEFYTALSGVRDEEGYIVQEGAYKILEDYLVDNIVVMGEYADTVLLNKEDRFDYQLALYCASLFNEGTYVRGYINYKPCKDTSILGIQRYANNLLTKDTSILALDSKGVPVSINGEYLDLGGNITKTAGPEFIFTDDDLGTIYIDPCLVAAAFDSSLKPQQSIRLKNIPGAKGLKYKIGKSLCDKLVGNKINVAHVSTEKNNKTTVEFYSSLTCALPGSDFQTISATDIFRYVIDEIRIATKPFRGEYIDTARQNACNQVISKKLSELKEKGVFSNFGFNSIFQKDSKDKTKVNMKLELALDIPGELNTITAICGIM